MPSVFGFASRALDCGPDPSGTIELSAASEPRAGRQLDVRVTFHNDAWRFARLDGFVLRVTALDALGREAGPAARIHAALESPLAIPPLAALDPLGEPVGVRAPDEPGTYTVRAALDAPRWAGGIVIAVQP